MNQPFPDEWKRLLDGMDARLRTMLDEATERPTPASPGASNSGTSLAETMQNMHERMDERLARLEQRILELDHDLSSLEREAQTLQQATRLPAVNAAQ